MIDKIECLNCNEILPSTFDDSISYYETLCKVIEVLNNIVTTTNEEKEKLNEILNDIKELEKTKASKSYVDNNVQLLNTKIENAVNEINEEITKTYISKIELREYKILAKQYVDESIRNATENMNKEAYIILGGRNNTRNISAIDFAIMPRTSANRFALMPSTNIVWERSSNGGETWTPVNLTGTQKIANVTSSNIIYVTDTTNTSINNQLRVTFTIPKGTYFTLDKLIINFASGGANMCEGILEVARYNKPDTFEVYNSMTLEGDSAFNTMNMRNAETAGSRTLLIGDYSSATNSDHVNKIRLTFKCNRLTSGRNNRFNIRSIYGYGQNTWGGLPYIAEYGTPYSILEDGRVLFQTNIQADRFFGKSTSAINDGDGNNIANTYVKKINDFSMLVRLQIVASGNVGEYDYVIPDDIYDNETYYYYEGFSFGSVDGGSDASITKVNDKTFKITTSGAGVSGVYHTNITFVLRGVK